MNEEQHLNILCIGQIKAGKSYFLSAYTQDDPQLDMYRIYTKKIRNRIIYFHELSDEEELYLEQPYDGMLFFIDLINHWKVTDNILKWLQLQSKGTGKNIFKIPIQIIVTKASSQHELEKWKKSLEKQLEPIVKSDQIIYFSDLESVNGPLQEFVEGVAMGRGEGIKSTYYGYWKLYGTWEILKVLMMNLKIVFFRFGEGVNRYRDKQLWEL